ncbi:MAG: dCTP deaminase [Planctomycetes bacterium]|nr:dCTP deaminase [Planctomycetota bacterium]
MKVLAGPEVAKRLEGAPVAEGAIEERGVALTARTVSRLESAARMGCEESEPAARNALAVERRDPEDRRGWWLLEEGVYLLELAEVPSLPAGAVGFLQPHPALLEAGASHPTVLVPGGHHAGPILLPLTVCERGLALQEGARVSLLVAAT